MMATKDGSNPGGPLPYFPPAGKPEREIWTNRALIFLRGLLVAAAMAICILFAGKPEQEIGTNRAVVSLRGLMVAAAIAICIAILSNQVTLFADVTPSLVDQSAPQPGTDQSKPTIQSAVIQSTAEAETLPATAKDASTPAISTSEAASRTETEDKEALFRQFKAWAAEQDARALAKTTQDTQVPVRPLQKQRRARPAQDARTQNQSAQNADTPSFLQTLFGASPPQRGRP